MGNKSKNLTFERFRETNLKRCEKHFHKLEDWSETDWCCCLAGEVGELCNFVKKRKRKINGKPLPKNAFLEECKKEIGDAGAYLDLIASRLGFRLEDCIRDKFNEVSDRIESKIKLC